MGVPVQNGAMWQRSRATDVAIGIKVRLKDDFAWGFSTDFCEKIKIVWTSSVVGGVDFVLRITKSCGVVCSTGWTLSHR